jgi:hypothetical protein
VALALTTYSDDGWKQHLEFDIDLLAYRAREPFGRFNVASQKYEWFATGDLVPMDNDTLTVEKIMQTTDTMLTESMRSTIWAQALRMSGSSPINTSRYLPVQDFGQEKNRMPTPTLSLYEVYITDRRFPDEAEGGILVEHVRATDIGDAKLKAILRVGYNETEIKFLNFGVSQRIDGVQPIDDDATTVKAYDACPDDNES